MNFWEGSGTAEDPYLIRSAEDLKSIKKCVNENGIFLASYYFKLTEDIELPEDFGYIGSLKPGATNTASGTNIWPFSGCLDGDGHTITIPIGGHTPFFYMRGAWIKNLSIYGEQIEGNGFSDGYVVDYGPNADYWGGGSPHVVTYENCVLKSGSKTKLSGFISGFASGQNTVSIKNCKVEKNVIIGYSKDQPNIGSFGGEYNGTIENCTSYADVYGTTAVGGILAKKGQSMGDCFVDNCYFGGNVVSSGEVAGGIVGSGYVSGSAPASPCVSIRNCTSDGTVSGSNRVGGIFGGEIGVLQCWPNGIGYIQNNVFTGKVTATDEDGVVGGIIGYMRSLDRYNIIEGNRWNVACGASSGIGTIETIDYTSENYGRPDNPFDVDKACVPFDAAGEKAIQNVIDKITAIGKVTLNSQNKINQAQSAYDALSTAQKALVTNVEVLTKAQSAYKALTSSLKWKHNTKGWWYEASDGSYVKNTWRKIGGKQYYFNSDGYMASGWKLLSGKWYYLGTKNDGAMKTGWQKVGGKWYYMNSSGIMLTGWQKVYGKQYYMNSAGAMLTGWQKVNGKWYYMNTGGAMQTGWIKLGSKWYYLYSDGHMAANTWVGKYYVNTSGIWTKSK